MPCAQNQHWPRNLWVCFCLLAQISPKLSFLSPASPPLSFFCIELTVCRCVCTCVYMCGDVHAKALKWRSENNLQKPALSVYFVVLGARTQINRQRAPLPSDKSPSIIINIQFNPITIPFFFFNVSLIRYIPPAVPFPTLLPVPTTTYLLSQIHFLCFPSEKTQGYQPNTA